MQIMAIFSYFIICARFNIFFVKLIIKLCSQKVFFYFFAILKVHQDLTFCNLLLKSFHAQTLKSDLTFQKKIIYFNESSLKMMKNAFYFILKALFI